MADRRIQSLPVEQERRQGQRRKENRRNIGIWVEEVNGEAKYFHYSSNISYSGLFLEKRLPLPLKAEVSLELAHPKTDDRLTVKGVVVNWRTNDQSVSGMGIEFVELDPEARAKLHAFVDSVNEHWRGEEKS